MRPPIKLCGDGANVGFFHKVVTPLAERLEERGRDAQAGEISYREVHAELLFHEASGLRPIAIPDEVIRQRCVWHEIAELAQRSKRPIHLADVCKLIDTPDPSHACYQLRQVVKASVVRTERAKGRWRFRA